MSAIVMQFCSTGLIAWNFHRSIVSNRPIAVENALKISLVTILVSDGGTAIMGHWSGIYLMPSGAYCFYQFDSPAMLFWADPILITTAVQMCICYYKIYKEIRMVEVRVQPMRGPHDDDRRRNLIKLAKRFFQFVLALIIGWFPALVASIFMLAVGHISQYLDTFVGVDGSLHTWFIVIIYYIYRPAVTIAVCRWGVHASKASRTPPQHPPTPQLRSSSLLPVRIVSSTGPADSPSTPAINALKFPLTFPKNRPDG